MFAAHLYDAVMLYAKALNRTITNGNLTEPSQIVEAAMDGRKMFSTIISDREYPSKCEGFDGRAESSIRRPVPTAA